MALVLRASRCWQHGQSPVLPKNDPTWPGSPKQERPVQSQHLLLFPGASAHPARSAAQPAGRGSSPTADVSAACLQGERLPSHRAAASICKLGGYFSGWSQRAGSPRLRWSLQPPSSRSASPSSPSNSAYEAASDWEAQASPTDNWRLVNEVGRQSLGVQGRTCPNWHPSKATRTQAGHRVLTAAQPLTSDGV